MAPVPFDGASSSRLDRALRCSTAITSVTLAVLAVGAVLEARPARAGQPPPPLFTASFFALRGAAISAAAQASNAALLSGVARAAQITLDLQRATRALAAAQVAQAAAAQAAAAAPNSSGVPEGLAVGGLYPTAGAAPGTPLWSGAALPTQSGPAGAPTVTVVQSARQAVLTWQSFNVGRNTHLVFDQSAGGAGASTWSVLNQLDDTTVAPSQILGSISAPGQVILINGNGVIFGGTAQVQVGSLVASTAALSPSAYAQSGLDSPNPATPSFTGALSPVVVEAGASLGANAAASLTQAGGAVLLFGSDVRNAGMISTPNGQAALVAGRNIVVTPGLGSNGDANATVLGSELAVTGPGGTAENTGLMAATDGDVTLVGHSVSQAGAIATSTGLGQRGTVHLLTDLGDPTASVSVGSGSLIYIGIDSSEDTAIAALRQTGPHQISVPIPVEPDDWAGLADVQDRSRIEITSGGLVALDPGALAVAPSGQIAIEAKGRVYVGAGADLDVAGLQGVTVPADQTIVSVSVEPYNLRDSPVNRQTGNLNARSVYLDAALLSYLPPGDGDSSARLYTQGGLFEVSGEVGNSDTHTIAEYATTGGTIAINAGSVVATPGASFDIAGGSILHQAGQVQQSWLTGADGRLYLADTAPNEALITGLFQNFSETHTRWNTTDSFGNPLLGPPTREQAAYTVGRDAGALDLSAPIVVFEGAIDGSVTQGSQQRAAPSSGQTGLLATQTMVAQAGTFSLVPIAVGGKDPPEDFDASLVIGDTVPPLSAGFGPTSPLPSGSTRTIRLSAPQLSADAIGTFAVSLAGSVELEQPFTLQPGGALTLNAERVDIAAAVIAPSASVDIGDRILSGLYGGSPVGVNGSRGVNVAPGGAVDTRGLWTNARLPGTAPLGTAWINGGAITIDTTGSIALPPGSTLDASGGGSVAYTGAFTGGAGGAITLIAEGERDENALVRGLDTALTLQGVVRSSGYTTGGALTLSAGAFVIGDDPAPATADTTVLPASFFASGFSSYSLTARGFIDIAPGTTLDVVEPLEVATQADLLVPGGQGPITPPVLQPLFVDDPRRARLTQRPGADLQLTASGASTPHGAAVYGSITLGVGAGITLDPGHHVTLDSSGALLLFGTIEAPGGSIAVQAALAEAPNGRAAAGQDILWVAPGAVLDTAGLAVTALDFDARPFGTVTPGGTVSLGGAAPSDLGAAVGVDAAFVVVRPGATIDVSGAAATLDLAAGRGLLPAASSQFLGTVTDDTGGGTIALGSSAGIFNDGTLRAFAGGDAAPGGTLDMVIETPIYSGPPYPRPAINIGRTIQVDQQPVRTLPEDAQPGVTDLTIGASLVSADTVAASGFGSLLLYARSGIVFAGNVTLDLPQSITLVKGALSDTSTHGQVAISAPYVLLSGQTDVNTTDNQYVPEYEGERLGGARGSELTISADVIDVQNRVEIGAQGNIPGRATPYRQPGFATLNLVAQQAVRFVNGNDAVALGGGTGDTSTILSSAQDIVLTAGQVYPTTLANATIEVSQSPTDPPATVTFQSLGPVPAPPLSLFGTLEVLAPTIDQGGVVRAPLGLLRFGVINQFVAKTIVRSVTLLPGSITSASGYGVTAPFGGTADGLTYDYDGQPVDFPISNFTDYDEFAPYHSGINLEAMSITADAGATIDLRGGGDVTGAAFVAGRGGSTDTLYAPQLIFGSSGVQAPSLGAGDEVFAILPGFKGPAPVAPLDEASLYPGSRPGAGQTVSFTGNQGGLPAGTYTLLPSYYALLPGAFRVELRPGITGAAVLTTQAPDGSVFEPGYLGGLAGVTSALPTQAIVSSGQIVRAFSQYDETSYAQFAVEQPSVALFGGPRPILPADARELFLGFPPQPSRGPALSNAATTLFGAAPGGASGILAVSGDFTDPTLEIAPAGTPHGAQTVLIDVAALQRFGAGSLRIGGDISVANNESEVKAAATSVIIGPGSFLSAPEIFIITTSGGIISIDPGATLSTVGQPLLVTNSAAENVGYNAASFIVLSNQNIDIAPGDSFGGAGGGAITVAAGSALLSANTLAFSTLGDLNLSTLARYGASNLIVSVPNINVGDPAVLAAAAQPAGLALTPDLLAALLAGGDGAPALQNLNLTVTGALNFFGDASIDTTNPVTGVSSLQALVLNTPGIYGYSLPGEDDTARIVVGTLYWNGAATSNDGTLDAMAPPLAIPGGPGSGSGQLQIDTQTLIFGYGPLDHPNDTVPLPRAIFGFDGVTLSAAKGIVLTDPGTLQVAQTQGLVQSDMSYQASGGTLHILAPQITSLYAGSLTLDAAGDVTLGTPGGPPDPTLPAGAGGSFVLRAGGAITDATAIVLPSGSVTLNAAGSLSLASGALIDLQGQSTPIFDAVVTAQGGDAVLLSTGGDVVEAPGASIVVGGAPGQPAGSLWASAAAGSVMLAGSVTGGGATPAWSGTATIDSGSLSQGAFDALNATLNQGGLLGGRAITVEQGSLAIETASGLRGNDISVVLDGGALTVDGLIDASGPHVGTIALAASAGLTLTGRAILDASGSTPVLDSYGLPIPASNRAHVTLGSGTGVLNLQAGASIELTGGGFALGDVELNAPRTGVTSGDALIAVGGPVSITGAATIAVNAFTTYSPKDGLVTQATLDAYDLDSRAFIDAADAPGGLAGRLTALGAGVELRPGVVVSSAGDAAGTLTVLGEIDLSHDRYGPGADTSGGGGGQPGVLVLRAANDLNIQGSISDGFGAAPASPDQDGWVRWSPLIISNNEQNDQPIITQVPISVLHHGKTPDGTMQTSFQAGDYAVNYPLPLAGLASIQAGMAVPTAVTLNGAVRLTQPWIATGTVSTPDGVTFHAGQLIPAGTLLPGKTTLGPGASLPDIFQIAAVVWPAGASLAPLTANGGALPIGADFTIPAGGLIPGTAVLVLPNGAAFAPTRAKAASGQGSILPLAPLLAAGTLSWSISLVAGANLGSPDLTAVAPPSAGSFNGATSGSGDLVLDDPHYASPRQYAELCIREGCYHNDPELFSVIRTGTGSLALAASGSILQYSPYGIYTAGTQSPAVLAADGSGFETSLLNPAGLPPAYAAVVQAQQVAGVVPYYPEDGGDVSIAARGDIETFNDPGDQDATAYGEWLWRQASPSLPTAWSINYGSYAPSYSIGKPLADLVGFVGFGALGGGDLSIDAGGDAGTVPNTQLPTAVLANVSGVDAAIGGTGRVIDVQTQGTTVLGGALDLTGGGDLAVSIGGKLNPFPPLSYNGDAAGTLTDVRGTITVAAGSIGSETVDFDPDPAIDPRVPVGARTPTGSRPEGGIFLVLGDASASLWSATDLVLGGVGDAGRGGGNIQTPTINLIPGSGPGSIAGFSLWRPDTSISLIAAGGDLTPNTESGSGTSDNGSQTDGRQLYPPILYAAAPWGNVLGVSENSNVQPLETAPSPDGQLTLLAGLSVIDQQPIALSGAPSGPNLLSNPFRPAYQVGNDPSNATNPLADFESYANPEVSGASSLFAFEYDTPVGPSHAVTAPPIRVYAGQDIVGLVLGGIQSFAGDGGPTTTWYLGGAPSEVRAGRDIVSFGKPRSLYAAGNSAFTGGLFVNGYTSDVSLLEAGRDIIYANLSVAGPGLLFVSAGRDFYQADQGVLTSLGQAVVNPALGAASRAGGASITVLAGIAAGVDWTAFANLYLNDANLANPALLLSDPANAGKVERTYGAALLAWLQANLGYQGTQADALATFEALPVERQSELLLSIYFEELRLSGREYNDPTSRFYRSYQTGKQAIATLLPNTYDGQITLFGGSGVRTDFGGDITLLAPGGATLLGVASTAAPPATAGIITYGQGDVDIYSLGSVLLGQSRVFTTFGGGITIWSAQGDINAGLGAKSTVVAQPFQVSYDDLGNITLSPGTPTTGAGIATLSEIPGTTPGDVDLIAPVGTIDAGEAGIRASGNANLAARFIANALNIDVKGKLTGLPQVVVPNVTAALAASAAAGAQAQAAVQSVQSHPRQSDSIITVEVIGFGG